MGWKNLSYWLKGGIIGLVAVPILFIIIAILSVILVFLPLGHASPIGYISYFIQILSYPSTPLFYLLDMIPINNGFVDIIVLILALLSIFLPYFILGAIIGWIYRKIKNRQR